MTTLQVPTPAYAQSLLSSRSSSPSSGGEKTTTVILEPGTQPDYVYDNALPPWRAAIRRWVVKSLRWESECIANMQRVVRRPWLDTYFVYTSTLGTHTFFMTVLPAFFFFGYPTCGRGLVQILSFGVYTSTFVKDSICSPRPYTPPVTRLTIGTHHLEYGFPSTHSTNSLSVALYIFTLCLSLPPWGLAITSALLSFYIFSIVYGRLYCAMHSFTDCIAGCLIGTLIWSIQWAWQDRIEQFMAIKGPLGKPRSEPRSEWSCTVPTITILMGLLLINQHPEPVDDCPCFEDAIAFVSVVMGTTLGRWHGSQAGLDAESGFFHSLTPGWQLANLNDWLTFFGFALLKMLVGIAAIFLWRLVMKTVLLAMLPPFYRIISHVVTLPTRRFYTPATQYTSVPQENGLHLTPSLIDIPTSEPGPKHSLHASIASGSIAKQRGAQNGREKWPAPVNDVEISTDRFNVVKHYDASVITKVVVYAGIGWISSEMLPAMFEIFGWGVKSGGRQWFAICLSTRSGSSSLRFAGDGHTVWRRIGNLLHQAGYNGWLVHVFVRICTHG
ncbi:acid phosphatase/Vanadium-dependent haloperoxidase [Dacryopinax primogenitus]|uniref:Acid phosphatase/Vanadium-dependent haloperoxidase n=1 Tax=Dacryopinax primogenitus (strain DJM 731) TaxID=1858805 RepID=M5G6I0_DACPD|nr:acid phosphatase/Vanadium-dependent haloperoxidase [Dacryopinax primogenitus]EJT99372.1 acid phosphatase/Vanadium-dependent haloperoxidase [Dacryopinax primogenitus]